MKKINNRTGNFFIRGEICDSGLIFWRYETKKDVLGFRYLTWLTKDKFDNLQKLHRQHEHNKRKTNNGVLKNRTACAKYYYKNKPKFFAREAKRRALKLQRMPLWLNDLQKLKILEIYKKAKQLTEKTGIVHHVDHIIPLKNNKVSGLHVPWNLQILTATENLKKHNNFTM